MASVVDHACSLNSSLCSGSSCYCSWFQKDAETYKKIITIIRLYLYPIMCAIGIPANLIALITFRRQQPWTTTHVYLAGLGVAYLLRLAHDLFMACMAALAQSDQELVDSIDYKIYYGTHFLLEYTEMVGCWCIMGAALDRCIFVVNTERAHSLCTTTRATFVVITGFVTILIVPWPRLFNDVFDTFKDGKNNTTCECVTISPTYFHQDNPAYMPYTFLTVVFKGAFTICVLLGSSIKTILGIWKRQMKKKPLARFVGKWGRPRISDTMATLIRKLVWIEVLYIICLIPESVAPAVGVISSWEQRGNLYRGYCEINGFLLTFNAAVSLGMYLMISKKVRQDYKKLISQTPSGAGLTQSEIDAIEAKLENAESRRDSKQDLIAQSFANSKSTVALSNEGSISAKNSRQTVGESKST